MTHRPPKKYHYVKEIKNKVSEKRKPIFKVDGIMCKGHTQTRLWNLHYTFPSRNAVLGIHKRCAGWMVVVLISAFANLLFCSGTSAHRLMAASFESVAITRARSRREHACRVVQTPIHATIYTMATPSLCHPPFRINIVIITSTNATLQSFHLIFRAV